MVKGFFGVIGHPIKHSLSPEMHNSVFRALGMDYEYSAFDVPPEKLGTFIERCVKENFIGLNVTIPHKISVMEYLDSVSKEADLIGAVNTIKFEHRKVIGYNTDGVGCIEALKESGEDVRGRKILILGSGGAARAIVFQLVLENTNIIITNRTYERALQLKKEIKEKLNRDVEIIKFSNDEIKNYTGDIDILINTTPVGMYPEIDKTPIAPDLLNKDIVVMDIIYNPIETKLLKEAKKIGCKTVNGIGMFIHQGAESLRIWLDIEPPIDLMRKTVLNKLKQNGSCKNWNKGFG